MIKNARLLSRFEKEQVKKEKLTYEQNLKIADALWKEGVALGVLPPKDPLEGIESVIKLARILNSYQTRSRKKR
jgi:hypothetical protein